MNSAARQEPPGRAYCPESLTEQRARHRVFGVDVDIADQTEAVREVMQWCRTGIGGVVVTPNLDHIVKLETSEPLRLAYKRARLVLPDGRPLIWMARLTGGPRLSLVTGSDLVEPICAAAAREGYSIFLFGSCQEVLETTAEILLRRHSGLRIAGFYAPPMGFDTSEEERRKALEAVRAARTDIVFVALGAPKQEIWATDHFEASGAKAILCIGAGLDFVAGAISRAPMPFRRLGLEWLWRTVSEPRRLGGRYLGILSKLPRLTLRHFADARRPGSERASGKPKQARVTRVPGSDA